jgi:hypothetical protein
MPRPLPFSVILLLVLLPAVRGAITITGVVDKTKYNNTATFLIVADPNAASTTATLDDAPVAVGSSVTVTEIRFHELRAESRDANGALVDSRLVRFIVRDNSGRGGTEDGIPPHTPFKSVPDAPSAFAGGTLKVIAPAAWPVGLPVPLAAVLRDQAGEGLRLNGTVTFAGLPRTRLLLRRGWGSATAAAIAEPGARALGAEVNGLEHNPTILFEAAPSFTDVSGAIASDTTWPANSRIRVTGTLTVNAGVTLTVGPGTIVLVSTGTAANASAAEIVVNGALHINGADGNPIVFAPETAGKHWGGIELPAATSVVNATHAIFTGAGEDETWFDNDGGYGGSSHRAEQALFLIVGSGTGTAVGAQLHLTDCYSFDHAGQQMNSKTNTWINLSRVLMQRCITCGELNGSKVTIDRSALIEFPGETEAFVDGDNDGIYLTNGDHSITNTVVGFTKDDGVDSGASGGDNPYTAAADVTPFVQANNWFEGTFHEGNSLSGTRNVSYTGCVFFNCGQGIEAGYSASSTGDGPNAVADGCLFIANMVGARRGDNYGSSYSYNSTLEVKNSLLLHNLFRDVWSYHWHPTAAGGWVYLDHTALNSFGRPICSAHGNRVTELDAAHHPANSVWNAAADGVLLAPFMPVPGSNVGVAISSYAAAQRDPSAYPGSFTVRLSTFSSRPVSVAWSVTGKVDAFAEAASALGGGTLTFAPGETLKTIAAPIAAPAAYEAIHVALSNPVNAEVTGDAWFFQLPPTPSPGLISTASGGWRFRQTRSEPPANWKTPGFDDSSAAATEWLPCTLPAGFGVTGVTFGTTVSFGSNASDKTKAYYFRKKFIVDDPAAVSALTLRIRRDDAAVVWLNNEAVPTVVSADGTFAAPYSYDATTLAAGNVPNSSSTGTYFTHAIPPSKLVAGENILAVQIHQTSLTSGDLIFDCELTAAFAAPFELNLTRSGGRPVLWWFGEEWMLEESADLETWFPVPGAASPLPFAPAISRGFFRLRR